MISSVMEYWSFNVCAPAECNKRGTAKTRRANTIEGVVLFLHMLISLKQINVKVFSDSIIIFGWAFC